jgi:hypothetical protein
MGDSANSFIRWREVNFERDSTGGDQARNGPKVRPPVVALDSLGAGWRRRRGSSLRGD